MKIHSALLMIALLGLVSFPAQAEDEFGARFSNIAPTGLTEKDGPSDPLAPQNIEPAAGAETQDDSAEVPPQVEQTSAPQDPTGAGSPKPLDSR